MIETQCQGHGSTVCTGGTICPRCGGRIPSDDMTETMLGTLAQLAQFGLDAEGRPLLERSAQEHG